MTGTTRRFDRATYIAIRYGYGFSGRGLASSADEVLDRLASKDVVAERFPVMSFEAARSIAGQFQRAKKAQRNNAADGEALVNRAKKALRGAEHKNLTHAIARILGTRDPFRERLTWFWADHFSARTKSAAYNSAASGYVEAAIRPHVAGRFADMLKAAVTHPVMLVYLDQVASVGPGSRRAEDGKRGLNENLAREILELHTLGVGGAYAQTDVRQFAELLTGLTYSQRQGFRFLEAMAEPGAETVLGQSYGGDGPADLDTIFQALEDLARHPDTARHLATKIARHFVADAPDPDLVNHLEAAYLASDGDLLEVYTALFNHPAAWENPFAKVKPPFDFIVSALLALGIPARDFAKLEPRLINRAVRAPMARMGQPFMLVPGPDGWPDSATDWVTPQGLADRITWGMEVPKRLVPDLPDPRRMVQSALGEAASPNLIFAANAAETRVDGVGLIFAAPEFNRR